MKLLKIVNKNQVGIRQFSTLYTWGDYPAGLGWGEHQQVMLTDCGQPKKVMENVKQISMGRDHSALITQNGELMTSGCGESFQLGNNKEIDHQKEFHKVEYFENMKVKQVECDDRYTVVLTEDGQVFDMGVKQRGWLINNYSEVNRIDINEVVTSVACGRAYGMAIGQSGTVYSWGVSDYGCQGDGGEGRGEHSVWINYRFQQLKDKKGLVAKRIRLAGNSTVVLMSDGSMWSCGQNYKGQLGLRKHWGQRTDQFNEVLKPMVDTYIKGEEIVDFDVSEMCTVVLSKSGKVFWSGFNQSYLLSIDEKVQKGVKIAVRDDCYYVLHADGRMTASHPLNCLFNQSSHYVFQNTPKQIGGNYGISYALL